MITHKSIGYSGRLGNQMFQYAALKAQSLRIGIDCYLPNHTNLKADGCFDLTNNKWISYKLDLYDCFKITTKLINRNECTIYTEKDYSFDSSIVNVSDNTAIEGYFQSYKYFEDYDAEIRKEFTFKDELLAKCTKVISNYSNTVAIHIRRGDQVAHPGMWNVTLAYIQEALNQFTDDEYTFLVFSDDINWCKQVFPDGVIFMEGNSQYEDMCLMTLCNHNIISNSTFSWWAAYLNSNSSKKVLAPKNWFTDKNINTSDLIPSTWVLL